MVKRLAQVQQVALRRENRAVARAHGRPHVPRLTRLLGDDDLARHGGFSCDVPPPSPSAGAAAMVARNGAANSFSLVAPSPVRNGRRRGREGQGGVTDPGMCGAHAGAEERRERAGLRQAERCEIEEAGQHSRHRRQVRDTSCRWSGARTLAQPAKPKSGRNVTSGSKRIAPVA